MTWEKIASLFDIEPGVIREAADVEAEKSKKEVFPEDVLIYEICETYPEWSRMRKLVPYICTFNKDEFSYVLLLGRSPLARILLFKSRADCGTDKGAELTLEEFLYGNPLLPPEAGTVIQRTGFVKYWIEGEKEEGAIERLKIIGYSEEEAKGIVKKVKKEAGIAEIKYYSPGDIVKLKDRKEPQVVVRKVDNNKYRVYDTNPKTHFVHSVYGEDIERLCTPDEIKGIITPEEAIEITEKLRSLEPEVEEEQYRPTKEDILADIKKRMEQYK